MTVSESIPLPTISVSPTSIFLCATNTYYSHLTIFLVFSGYVYFADASVPLNNLTSDAPTIMAPPAATNIEVVVISLSTGPSAEPSTKVPLAFQATMLFLLKRQALVLGAFLKKVIL